MKIRALLHPVCQHRCGQSQLPPELWLITFAALIYFDYCITFPDEVRLIWRRKFRYITALYILCRYAMLSNLLYLLYMAGFIPKRVCLIAFYH